MCAIGDSDDDLWNPAVSIDEEGRVHGRASKAPAAEVRPAIPPPEEPLELADRPPVTSAPAVPPVLGPEETTPPRKSNRVLEILAVVVLLAAGTLIALHFLRAPAPGRPSLAGSAPSGVPVLTIDSVPPGAVVLLDGAEVGRTPYLATNEFGAGAMVHLRIVRPGYKTWEGTFRGGLDVRVTARLRR
jgi:eukaryotic-like serine/threonine-protein kinase